MKMAAGIQTFAPIADEPRTRLPFSKRLRSAIERRELTLHYQPQYQSSDGEPCGVEALARWFPRRGESIAPVIFIRHAEQNGLISALGKWALQEACETVSSWQLPSGELPLLCVNVSPHQIGIEFAEFLEHSLERTGFPASHLQLEITEGILIEDADVALQSLARWKQTGVRIALDDFGTGYSSLSYLSQLPVDRLKIDRSLIHRVTEDSKTAAIVRAIISLGADLGIDVLAEGVESEAQYDILVHMGCQQMQGYLFTRPVPGRQAAKLLTRRWKARGCALPVMAGFKPSAAHAT